MKGILFTGRIVSLALVTVLFAPACRNDKGRQKPPDLLTKNEMIAVLQEIYIAEEKVNRLVLPRDSAEVVFEFMRVKVFEKTGVPDSVFKRSFDYYMDQPAEMELIYTGLVDSLQLREQRAPGRVE